MRISTRIFQVIFLAVVTTVPLSAQTTGNCRNSYPYAFADLDVADVRARMFNDGGFFWHGGENIYEVPKGSGITPIGTTNLWMGGYVDGDLRLSGSNYCCWEMWPGPLSEDGNAPDDCSLYDRLYSVYDDDIRHYNETGEGTADIRDWPWELGAPVADGDGNPDNYDLEAGDRPHVFGDQTVWWVMNDAGNRHSNTDTDPIGIEVRVSAFASTQQSLWIPYTTFYRFELVNKLDSAIDSFYFGVYSEGDVQDHYVGSDSVAGIAYLYNNDDWDEGGYGDRPPALGYTFLQGPLVDTDGRDNDHDGAVDEHDERLRLTSFISHSHGGDIQGWPTKPEQWYGYLQAQWRDGSQMTFGGNGRGFSTTTTRFMYSGTPPAYWSEDNPYGSGWSNVRQLGTMIMSTGPFHIEPDDIQEIIFAIIFSQGNDRLDSVYRLLGAPASLRNALPYIMAFDTTVAPSPPPPEIPPRRPDYRLFHYPQPASEIATFDFELPTSMFVRLVLYDALGREVAVVADGPFAEGTNRATLSLDGLPAGSYFCRLETQVINLTRPITLIR